MHAAAQKIARALISHSPFHRCARKISRFARNDDAGKAILSFSACLRRISPLSFIPPVPYPPLRGTFPSKGRLLMQQRYSRFAALPMAGRILDFSLLWKEVSRRSGGWLPQRDEMKCETTRPPVSSSRAQPKDLSCRRENSTYEEVRHSKSYEVRCLPLSHIFCLTSVQGRFLDFARNDDTGEVGTLIFCLLETYFPSRFHATSVYDMHAAAQKTARTLISHSPFHQCAKKISRFARNDDAGKALLSFSAYLKRFSLSLSYRHCPIRPFGAPSPQGEGYS